MCYKRCGLQKSYKSAPNTRKACKMIMSCLFCSSFCLFLAWAAVWYCLNRDLILCIMNAFSMAFESNWIDYLIRVFIYDLIVRSSPWKEFRFLHRILTRLRFIMLRSQTTEIRPVSTFLKRWWSGPESGRLDSLNDPYWALPEEDTLWYSCGSKHEPRVWSHNIKISLKFIFRPPKNENLFK